MSFNANPPSRNAGLGRKLKRVSDVAALGMAPGGNNFQQPAAQTSFDSFNTAAIPPQTTNQPMPVGGFDQPSYGFNVPGMQQSNIGFQTYVPVREGFSPPPPGATPPPGMPFIPQPTHLGSMLQQPMVQDMAMQYGQHLASHGKNIVNKEIEKYVSVSRLKYYFAVDTKYVLHKLFLIFFPFSNKDWSIKYEHNSPLQPRIEHNAPDLYIPTMAYVTYVFLAGFILGTQHRFSPEQIGMQASSALAYTIFEIFLYLATLYITNIQTNLSTFDLIAFSGYKYAIIIAVLVTSVVFNKLGYYVCLIYCSFTLAFFLVRTLKVQVLVEPSSQGYSQDPYTHTHQGGGSKRRVYFLLFVAGMQPALSWWLTYHLLPVSSVVSL